MFRKTLAPVGDLYGRATVNEFRRRPSVPARSKAEKENGHDRREPIHPCRSRSARHARSPPGGGAQSPPWRPGHDVRAAGGSPCGGFARPIDDDSLRAAIQAVLPATPLGELESIKSLPGMVDAAADTLHKAWRAGIDLQARAGEHPRLDSIARLEAAVLAQLPAGMMRPVDLVAAACQPHRSCPLFGPVEIVGITELSPCWRPLLHAMPRTCRCAGPPARGDARLARWHGVTVARERRRRRRLAPSAPRPPITRPSRPSAGRGSLLASGAAEPADIAIAAASPADYDDHFLALRADANLDLHFVHGIKIDDHAGRAKRRPRSRTSSCAAFRRPGCAVWRPCCGRSPARSRLSRGLDCASCRPTRRYVAPSLDPPARPLTPADWPDGTDHGPALRAIIVAARRAAAAPRDRRCILHGRALAIWRKALLAGPAASLDTTLETLKQDDGLEACVSVAWMPASALAASPRRFVRLLGLNSSRWPRGISEDRLLSDHIIPTAELDPLPVGAADRRDFETILATTERQVVLSRARRDSDGRLLGRSTLLPGSPTRSISAATRSRSTPSARPTD